MKLTFYNHYGVGDLYESREFVREWMKLLGVTTATYACRFPGVFEDMSELECVPVDHTDYDMRQGWERRGDEIRINTWIGCRNGETKPRGNYVLWPGVGCTVEHLQRMHLDYAYELSKHWKINRENALTFQTPFTRPTFEYIPDIHYGLINRAQKESVDRSLVGLEGAKLVLICNGLTGSGHASNFSMLEMLNGIAPDPKRLFIFTERRETERPDVVFTDDITGRKPGETDVLAISYLSTFCHVIVGRCSGAQMPCETRSNWMDESKTLVSFTQHRNGACFVREPEKLGLKMRLVHSDATTPEQAREVLKGVL